MRFVKWFALSVCTIWRMGVILVVRFLRWMSEKVEFLSSLKEEGFSNFRRV